MWYPTQRSVHASPMPYSGYLHVGSPDQSFAEFNKRVEEYDYKSVRNFFKSETLFEQLLRTPTAAFLNAPAAQGSFPLVVYSLGQNDHTLENIVLWEFLASHGYVVVTIPHIGTSPLRFQLLVHDPLMYEAQARDLEFVIQQMHELPYVHSDKLALIGHSFGGIYSLLIAMRYMNINAVIGLDPTYMSQEPSFYYKFWEAPYYDAGHSKAPMLVLYKGIESENSRMDIVDDLKFSDRYLFKFPHLTHGDFNSSPMVTSLSPGNDYVDREYTLKYRSKEDGIIGHQIICRYVLNFLDAFLKDDTQSLQFIQRKPEEDGIAAGTLEYEFKPGLKVPTEEELCTIIQNQGLDAAIKAYQQARERYPTDTIIRESVLRRIGNEAGYYGNSAQAVEIFKLYVEACPQSSAAYESLAGAYEDAGDKDLAIKNYERSLEINPQNDHVRDRLKRLKQK